MPATTATTQSQLSPAAQRMRPVSRTGEAMFRGLCLVMASAVLVLVVLVGYQLWRGLATLSTSSA